jgi:multiple sugar transport system substrate-binding protein
VQLQRVRALPAVPEIESIVARVLEHAEASIRGGRPAAASLAALDADVDRILEKRRWMLNRKGEGKGKGKDKGEARGRGDAARLVGQR